MPKTQHHPTVPQIGRLALAIETYPQADTPTLARHIGISIATLRRWTAGARRDAGLRILPLISPTGRYLPGRYVIHWGLFHREALLEAARHDLCHHPFWDLTPTQHPQEPNR
jgi:hypothetical protein